MRSWRNGHGSVPVLLCNGLGAPAECWPGWYDRDDADLTVTSFFHRGTSGSGKPLDETAIGIDAHVADALAVMDAHGLSNAVVVGWSTGVPVAFQLTHNHPDRVAAVLAVSGVPGGGEGINGLLAALNGSLTGGAARAAQLLPGPVLALLGQIPVNDATVGFLRKTGLVSADADPRLVAAALSRYLEHEPQWYMKLLQEAAKSDLGGSDSVDCPVRFLVGRSDVIIPPPTVVAAAHAIPHAHARIVAGSHFLPLEQPALIKHETLALAAASGVSDGGGNA